MYFSCVEHCYFLSQNAPAQEKDHSLIGVSAFNYNGTVCGSIQVLESGLKKVCFW